MTACGTKVEKEATPEPQSETLMHYRDLGNTGIQVSEIGLGCAAFSDLDSTQSREFMDLALSNGMNYIDIYDSDPKVRSNIGYALQGRREQMNIQAHIGAYWEDGHYARTRDVEKCKVAFDDMLDRLGTDHIEVGMMHIVDSPEQWAEIEGSDYLEYVKQLKAEGKIQHIGVSSHNAAAALLAVKSGVVEVLMFSLNPAFDMLPSGVNIWDPNSFEQRLPGIDPVRVELYDYCLQHGIGISVMKVFGGSRLLDADKSPLGYALTPVQCLGYALAKPCVSTALSGACSIEELQATLDYLTATDEEKDWTRTEQQTAENLGEGQCTYCNHCSPCPQGINIAKVNSLLDEAKKHDEVPAEILAEYQSLEHKAGECIECGACETRCPFGVSIREKMKEAKNLFGE